MTPGPLLFLAMAGQATAMVLGPRFSRTWLALTLVGALAALGAAVTLLLGVGEWEWRSAFAVGGEPLHLRLDGLSALFVVLLSVVGAAGAVYSRAYWSDAHYPRSAPQGRLCWSAFLLSLLSVLLASNGLHFLIAWELFTLSAYFLVTLDRRRREVRAAGWLFLAASHVGTLCLFALFASLAARTGSWELGPMRDEAGLAPLFWLALVGFGVKSGVFPLHVWLPAAHANAPSHVSAILSGVALKMGVYGLIRFSGWLPVPEAAGWVVIGLGAISALLGIAFAFAQNDLKRLLAYSSVENIGVIYVGLGLALLGAAQGEARWGRLALAGALLHVWNHGLFKSLLFFGAGSVLHATGTREMSRLGGLWRAMPWTAGLFGLGAMAVSALPPFNGFVSEWLVYLGLFDAAQGRGLAAWAALPAALMLAMTGALALASFVKAGAMVFLGAPRTQAASQVHESGWWMRGPMLVLAGGCVVLGLAPVLCWPALSRGVGAWRPVWAGTDLTASLAVLGQRHMTLAVVALGAAVGLWRLARVGLRRGLTWDCGYATPTPRMQYTSGSFAGIATGWFAPLFRVERALRRPRGPLPARASLIERVPETVLERVIGPVADAVRRFALLARRLQHGRLQFYIVYVIAGVAAVGTLVWMEGAQ